MTAGHPEPVFSQESGGVNVVLPSKDWLGPAFTLMPEKEFEHLSKRQREIIQLVKKQGEVTPRELISHITEPLSERTIQVEMRKLKEMGILDLQGFGRGAKWVLHQKTQKDAQRRSLTIRPLSGHFITY